MRKDVFGSWVGMGCRFRRIVLGMTQRELSQKVHTLQQTISKVETWPRKDPAVLAQLLAALDISYDGLRAAMTLLMRALPPEAEEEIVKAIIAVSTLN